MNVVEFRCEGLTSGDAAGAILLARKMLTPKAEQIFYAMFLIMIAAFYLAFAAYFGVATALRLETVVIVAFVAISLLGARLPLALIIGYSLHGLWDLLHELQVHGGYIVVVSKAARGVHVG